MKTIEIQLYNYDELSIASQRKALADWNENNDDPMMQSHMINLLKEELDERKIKYDADSIDVRYSLSHSQGDGFMFEGKIVFGQYTITVKHSGHYFHSYSKNLSWYKNDEEVWPTVESSDAFEEVYQAICKKMEQVGYDEIEYQTSEEHFIEECEANEYTFEQDGSMRNA